MSIIDWIILLLFFIPLTCLAIQVLKHRKYDVSDCFLSESSKIRSSVGVAIFTVNIDSEHIDGFAGVKANSGMAMAHWELQCWTILVLGWVFVPLYTQIKVFTMTEFLLKNYN